MMSRLSAVLLGAAVWLWPQPSRACSCMREQSDLVTALRTAQREASHIYSARVLSTDEKAFAGRATVQVLEVFKGKLTAGTRLELPSGGGGDCTYPFEPGVEYVVYAYDGPTGVGLCTRTRRAWADDVELQWLRTGKLPSVPVALQREAVSCQPCNLETVTAALVGPPPGDSCNMGLRAEEALAAFKAQRPFWTGGFYSEDSSRSVAVGLTMDLRPFELVQTPHEATDETCRQRVVLRWCERLEPTGDRGWADMALRCVNPGSDEERCDENSNRTAAWMPVERLSAATCEWGDPARPQCRLAPKPRPLPASPKVTGPLLKCSPGNGGSQHTCRVTAP